MEWDDGGMRETSVRNRRKRMSEGKSDQMDVDGELEKEEDAGREKKRMKLSAGPVGRGKGRAVSSDGKRKSGRASLLLWARGRVNANKRIT